jgi:4'-phosphopantetheinyl transferase EntD
MFSVLSSVAGMGFIELQENYKDELFDKYAINYPEEIRRAVIKRRSEYLAGRFCCQDVLKKLGANSTSVSTGKGRLPLWPLGYIGSLSHSGNRAIAVIGECDKVNFIGVDIEKYVTGILFEIVNEVISSEESNYLKSLPLNYELGLLLIFSAKESLFKALYSKVGFYFDFHSASIFNINVNKGFFEVRLNHGLSYEFKKDDYFKGFFYFDGVFMNTLIY